MKSNWKSICSDLLSPPLTPHGITAWRGGTSIYSFTLTTSYTVCTGLPCSLQKGCSRDAPTHCWWLKQHMGVPDSLACYVCKSTPFLRDREISLKIQCSHCAMPGVNMTFNMEEIWDCLKWKDSVLPYRHRTRKGRQASSSQSRVSMTTSRITCSHAGRSAAWSLGYFVQEEKKRGSSYLATTCGNCLCYRTWGLHHPYGKVDEFTFTGQFSPSYQNSALSRMTSPLYLSSTPALQGLMRPDLFLLYQFWKLRLKEQRKQLTELKIEMRNLVNQYQEFSNMKKPWQENLYELQYAASDTIYTPVSWHWPG